MVEVDSERWSWALFRHNEYLILSVVCGSVGIYTREVLLTKSDVEQFERVGSTYIKELAGRIRSNPESPRCKNIGISSTIEKLEQAIIEWNLSK